MLEKKIMCSIIASENSHWIMMQALRILSSTARFWQMFFRSIWFTHDLDYWAEWPVSSAILGEALVMSGNTGFRNVHLKLCFFMQCSLRSSTHCPLFFVPTTHRFLLRLSLCEGLCFSFSLHLSPSESDDSDSDDSLDDDDEDDDDEEEAEEDESDWTPVGSSICTLSAISAISALSFC